MSDWLQTVGIIAYCIIAGMSWFMLTVWWREERKVGWIMSLVIGLSLAVVWPLSLTAVVLNEKAK